MNGADSRSKTLQDYGTNCRVPTSLFCDSAWPLRRVLPQEIKDDNRCFFSMLVAIFVFLRSSSFSPQSGDRRCTKFRCQVRETGPMQVETIDGYFCRRFICLCLERRLNSKQSSLPKWNLVNFSVRFLPSDVLPTSHKLTKQQPPAAAVAKQISEKENHFLSPADIKFHHFCCTFKTPKFSSKW